MRNRNAPTGSGNGTGGKQKRRNERDTKGKGHRTRGNNANAADDASSASGASGSGNNSGENSHVTVPGRLMKKISAYTASDSNAAIVSILDTGALAHITPHMHWFKKDSYVPFPQPRRVCFGDHSYVEALGRGSITYRSTVDRDHYEVTINNVLYAPTFKITLVSVGQLGERDFLSRFG